MRRDSYSAPPESSLSWPSQPPPPPTCAIDFDDRRVPAALPAKVREPSGGSHTSREPLGNADSLRKLGNERRRHQIDFAITVHFQERCGESVILAGMHTNKILLMRAANRYHSEQFFTTGWLRYEASKRRLSRSNGLNDVSRGGSPFGECS